MILLGVLGGKSGVVIVVRAQDGLEVCCPCSLPLFESNKFMPKFQLDLGHSKKRAPLCIQYQEIICHHYHHHYCYYNNVINYHAMLIFLPFHWLRA